MFTRKKLATAIIMSGALMVTGCSDTEESEAQSAPAVAEMADIVRPVLIETVTSESEQVDFAYVGTVQAAQKADLSFELSGKLVSLRVEEGHQVKKGQTIAELDKTTLQNNYESSLAEYQKANKDTERLEAIYKANRAIALSDLESSRTQRDISKIRLDNVKQTLDNATLIAPFDGIIASKKANEFSFVQAKETIFTLQNLDELEVEVNIPGSAILTADENVKLAVVFDQIPDLKLPVKFKYIATEGDKKTQTYRVILSLAETGNYTILPGMSVTVVPDQSLPSAKAKSIVLVPLKAVVSDNAGKQVIWKVGPDGQVAKTYIETGALVGDRVTVIEGLTSGDRIVTAGVTSLRDGMKVRPLDQE